MNATRSAALAIAVVASLLSACDAGGSAPATGSTVSSEKWSETMTSIKLRNGMTVSLEVASGGAAKTLSSRCWRLVESRADGATAATTSACHGQGQTAASKMFGAIIVVSDCTNSPDASLHDSLDGITTRQLFDGMFLIPATSVAEDAQTLTYSCVNTAGEPGPLNEIKFSQ